MTLGDWRRALKQRDQALHERDEVRAGLATIARELALRADATVEDMVTIIQLRHLSRVWEERAQEGLLRIARVLGAEGTEIEPPVVADLVERIRRLSAERDEARAYAAHLLNTCTCDVCIAQGRAPAVHVEKAAEAWARIYPIVEEVKS